MRTYRLATIVFASAAAVAGLFWSGKLAPDRPGELVSPAEARIGRPLTPLSYAGVARRTTRRAVYAGAALAAGAAAASYYAAPYYAAPACVRVVRPSGAVVYRCP
jgi:heme A synthase